MKMIFSQVENFEPSSERLFGYATALCEENIRFTNVNTIVVASYAYGT